MSTFILIHGSFHGGWCWEKVANRLNEAGHTVLTPDLPGLGEDRTPAQSVTLTMTGSFIAELALKQSDKPILVGHSLGGVVISDAAERAPEAFAGLIYVSALLLPNGASAIKTTSQLPEGVSLNTNASVFTIDAESARKRYYSGCDEADVKYALAHLVPQPTGPLLDRLTVTPDRFGTVSRAYIECLHDKALPLQIQRAQHEAMTCHAILQIATGHSPFIQAPDEFVELLSETAKAFE